MESTQSISTFCLSIPQTGGLSNTLFEGGALWEAGQREKLEIPMEHTHHLLNNLSMIRMKITSMMLETTEKIMIIPEFRMSTQVEDYIRTDGQIETDMFDVVGGATDQADSSKSQDF